jgi:hypothetical protein
MCAEGKEKVRKKDATKMTQLRCKAKVDLHNSMEKWTMK